MNSQNYQTLEFFLSSYRLNNSEERSVLVTDNFTFTTPVAGTLNFNQFHAYNTVMRNYTEHELLDIKHIDEHNFIVKILNIVVENQTNYRKKIYITAQAIFVGNLIDSIDVKYSATAHDKEVFNKILKPFLDHK